MSEFNVGDWVVCSPKIQNPSFFAKVTRIENEEAFFTTAHGLPICWLRKATKAEEKAGHRIDEPCIHLSRTYLGDDGKQTCFKCGEMLQSEVVPKQPENTPEPLVSMGEGVVVNDAVREAFEKSFGYADLLQLLKFNVRRNRYIRIEHDDDSLDAAIVFNAGWEAWKARQAEVDEKQKRIDEQDIEIRQLKHFNDEYQAMLKDAKSALEKALGGGV